MAFIGIVLLIGLTILTVLASKGGRIEGSKLEQWFLKKQSDLHGSPKTNRVSAINQSLPVPWFCVVLYFGGCTGLLISGFALIYGFRTEDTLAFASGLLGLPIFLLLIAVAGIIADILRG